jgi:hypothetical protein
MNDVVEDEWDSAVAGGDWDGEARLVALRTGPQGGSTPLLMGESWPVWANPTVEDDTETEVESSVKEPNHGEGRPPDWASSEFMLRLSDHRRSPSSGTTGRGQSIARQ